MQHEGDILKLRQLVQDLPRFDGFGNGAQCDPHELLIKVLETESVDASCLEGKYFRDFVCGKCNMEHSTTELYNTLSLLPRNSVQQSIVADCGYNVEGNTEKTTVTATCEHCSKNTIHSVRSFIEAGQCLIVHFKIPTLFEPERTVGMFQLCAICYYHRINNQMGHYTAKCIRNNTWIYFDDTKVSTTPSQTGRPVMAFYM